MGDLFLLSITLLYVRRVTSYVRMLGCRLLYTWPVRGSRRRSWSVDPVAGGLTSGCGLHTYEVCGLPSRLALGYRVGALSGRGAGALHFLQK